VYGFFWSLDASLGSQVLGASDAFSWLCAKLGLRFSQRSIKFLQKWGQVDVLNRLYHEDHNRRQSNHFGCVFWFCFAQQFFMVVYADEAILKEELKELYSSTCYKAESDVF
jgi:hypothetical protein